MTNEKVVDYAQRLIKIKSYSGAENLIVEELKKILKEIGVDEIFIDKYGSVTAKITGNFQGKKVLMDSHIDTVVTGNHDNWKFDPFGANVSNGKIYGRGSSDMKGALASMIAAAEYFSKNRNFKGEVYVSGVVHEECFEGVGASLVSKNVNPDYVIIGESTGLNLNIGQRGRAEICVETHGKTSHSANPQKGINAIENMKLFLNELTKIKKTKHPILGDGIYVVTDIISSPFPGSSVVPENCKITLDRRTLVGETKKSIISEIESIIKKLENENINFSSKCYFSKGIESCYTGESISSERFFPAWIFDSKSDFVGKSFNALKNVVNDCKISSYSFCTNGSHYAGEKNIKTIGFGPSYEHLAHIVDEYVEIEHLIIAKKGYIEIIKSLLK